MATLTYRYKCRPSKGQYDALFQARRQAQMFRNACLQERIDSYRAACRIAARGGRRQPLPQDWIEARAEGIRSYLVWQDQHEPDLRRRHDQAEARRIAKLRERIGKGEHVESADRDG